MIQNVSLTCNLYDQGWTSAQRYLIESVRCDLLRNFSPSGGDWLRGEFSIFLSGWQVVNGHQKLLRKAVPFLDHKLLLFEIKDIVTVDRAIQTSKSI